MDAGVEARRRLYEPLVVVRFLEAELRGSGQLEELDRRGQLVDDALGLIRSRGQVAYATSFSVASPRILDGS